MPKINPKKLLNSKWTAVEPINKQKHWMITAVEYAEDQTVIECTIQAIINKQEINIMWRNLNDTQLWQQGWK